MTLVSGSRLGPYEILSPLGAGGMGEVYKARDTRLERTVAIKVLLPERLSSPEGHQRFEREAKALSQLAHPHICAIYDVGIQNGTEYLIMEYLEGETLTARLARGPLPLDQTLRYGIEIADALDQAHRQGIIHRDLKPSNVMLTKSGVKLLDFGLAKLMAPSLPSGLARASMLPTTPLRSSLTAEGTILGTFQYMAPEQLEGKEADARTDVFAFGATLYEMATGRKAFEATSQASLITAIMSSEPPPISASQPTATPALDRFVANCLAKDPDERWQTAHDLVLGLKWIGDSSGGGRIGVPLPNEKAKLWRRWLTTALAAAAVLGVILTALRHPRLDERLIRSAILPPAGGAFENAFALSPDGRSLVFEATVDGKTSLWIRSLDSLESRQLPGTQDGSLPFWSPDARYLGFFSLGKLKKLELSSGTVETLADATGPRGGSWSARGSIIFSPSARGPLVQISADGRHPRIAGKLDQARHDINHRWPFFLPDGDHFLYFDYTAKREDEGVYLGSLTSDDRVRLFAASSGAIYSSSGHLLFIRDRTLLAKRFQTPAFRLAEENIPIAEGVEPVGEIGPTGYAPVSASATGLLAYRTGVAQVHLHQLTWVDRAGKPLGLVGKSGGYYDADLSADGTRLALVRHGRLDTNLGLLDLSRNTSSRFTFSSSGNDNSPIWSPDGTKVAFSSAREGTRDLYVKSSASGSEETLLFRSAERKWPDDWSRDGRLLIFESENASTRVDDLWMLPLNGERKPLLFLRTRFNESHARLSPDMHWIAYESDESGASEVYVRSFPTPGGKWQVSPAGGVQPFWRRDGRELFYLSPAKEMMAAPVAGANSFEAGVPIKLFEARFPAINILSAKYYAASADGQRFLIETLVESESPQPITLTVNWTSGLRR